MLFFRSYFFKGSETDLNKLVQKQLALNSTRVTLESSRPINIIHVPTPSLHTTRRVMVSPLQCLLLLYTPFKMKQGAYKTCTDKSCG